MIKNVFQKDYIYEKWFYKIIGLKLEAHPLTIATAATLYHRFIKEAVPGGYDNYVNYTFIILIKMYNIYFL